jgi:lauroyl/myristoyl acyltransferase
VSDPAAPVRWYTHAWNRDLSWRLIHAVIPHVPRALRPPIHLLTTLICFAAMPRERRAARRNLERIGGRRGPASSLAAFRLFYNFSKFMVGYTDLPPFRDRLPDEWIEGRDAARRMIEPLLAEGRGLIVVTLHLGHWEMGLALLARLGPPVSVVIRPDGADGGGRFGAAVRERPGLRVIEAGEQAWNGLDLLLALRRGEVVAVQGDRPFGAARRRAILFGAPADLPLGPLCLAQASGAPLLLVWLPIRGHGRYRVHLAGPLRVGPGEAALQAAFGDYARRIEAAVAAHPTQWFNFYDVWMPDGRGATDSSRCNA